MTDRSKDQKDLDPQGGEKKPQAKQKYVKPAVKEYGSISKLTQGGGFSSVDGVNTMMMDNN